VSGGVRQRELIGWSKMREEKELLVVALWLEGVQTFSV
jgi:hypothetical protein